MSTTTNQLEKLRDILAAYHSSGITAADIDEGLKLIHAVTEKYSIFDAAAAGHRSRDGEVAKLKAQVKWHAGCEEKASAEIARLTQEKADLVEALEEVEAWGWFDEEGGEYPYAETARALIAKHGKEGA